MRDASTDGRDYSTVSGKIRDGSSCVSLSPAQHNIPGTPLPAFGVQESLEQALRTCIQDAD